MLPFDKLALNDTELYELSLHSSSRRRWGTPEWHDTLNDHPDGIEALLLQFASDLLRRWPQADPAASFWARWGPFEELANARSPSDYHGPLGPLALEAARLLGPAPDADLPRAARWLLRRHELNEAGLLIQGRSFEPSEALTLFRAAVGVNGQCGPGMPMESLAGGPAARAIEALALQAAPALRQELSRSGARPIDAASWSALPWGPPSARAAWVALIERALLEEPSPPAQPSQRPKAL